MGMALASPSPGKVPLLGTWELLPGVLSLTCCGAWGKTHSLSGLHFPPLSNKGLE